MPAMPWPTLREDLALLPGPSLADGQPSWTLHDPARNLFFQIDWASFEILSRWALGDADAVAAAVRRETTLYIDVATVEGLARFLEGNQLLLPPAGAAPLLAERRQRSRGGVARWLLHNYLFLRLPLCRPDRWLGRWAGRLEFFYGRIFLRLTLAAAAFGLLGVYREWERFSATFVDLLSGPGMLAYGTTLVAIKVLHELGHGFTAKRYGCRVPTMGVAFLVLWPVAYTDTNDVWKLVRRDQRMKVAAAGIVSELIVAAWATLAWAWLPDGGAKTAAFLLSTTTWISTIAVNASPFMRFDGYFLLSDYLRLPNLHARAFALARWDLRERLFALGEPAPEHLAGQRHGALVLFAWGTWLYRLVLFLGIAALVYQFFIKALGIFLFLVEIGWFLALPVWSEISAWRERWPAIRASRRTRRSAWIALAACGFFVVPWPSRIAASAMLQPREQLLIYAPRHARIAALPPEAERRVAAGTPILAMRSPDIEVRAGQANARRERLSWQSAAAGFDPEQRREWGVLDVQLAAANAEAGAVAADAAQYAPTAPFAGVLHDLDPDLRVGDWVGNGELLGRLVADGPWQAVTYVDEEDIRRIAPGDRALFIGDGLGGPTLYLEVAAIDRDATRALGEPELAIQFGGHVSARERNGIYFPERAVYRVVLKVVADDGTAPRQGWRGRLSIAGAWEAPGTRFLRAAFVVFRREAGF